MAIEDEDGSHLTKIDQYFIVFVYVLLLVENIFRALFSLDVKFHPVFNDISAYILCVQLISCAAICVSICWRLRRKKKRVVFGIFAYASTIWIYTIYMIWIAVYSKIFGAFWAIIAFILLNLFFLYNTGTISEMMQWKRAFCSYFYTVDDSVSISSDSAHFYHINENTPSAPVDCSYTPSAPAEIQNIHKDQRSSDQPPEQTTSVNSLSTNNTSTTGAVTEIIRVQQDEMTNSNGAYEIYAPD